MNFIGSTARTVAMMSSVLWRRPDTVIKPSLLPHTKTSPPYKHTQHKKYWQILPTIADYTTFKWITKKSTVIVVKDRVRNLPVPGTRGDQCEHIACPQWSYHQGAVAAPLRTKLFHYNIHTWTWKCNLS